MGTALVSQPVRIKVTAHTPAETVTAEVEVPAMGRDQVDVLPAIRLIDDALVARAGEESEAKGRPVTCSEGCGACCRQLVPVTESEARALTDLVESLPGERRAEVRARFETASSDLAKAGLVCEIRGASSLARQPLRELGSRYFHLGIACPFLEDERCSIYPQRPLVCREFLVSSPPGECATLGDVKRISVRGRLPQELRVGRQGGSSWVPLVLAPEWVDANPEGKHIDDLRPGPEILAEALGVN